MSERDPNTRMRAREAGIILGTLPPGTTNSIADVAGVRVGHTTLIRGNGALVRGVGPVRTGVTAILPHDDDLFRLKVPAAASVFNGFGKTIGLVQLAELGQLETPILLTNTLNVGRVADALVAFMVERNPAIGVTTGTVNPVVCECNDGFLNDIGGRHVGEQEVRAALTVAPGTPVLEGNVGAGTGMTTYCFAGGIGTASRCLSPAQGGYTLGALVQSNFGRCGDLIIGGVPVGRELEEQRQKRVAQHVGQEPGREQGSIIVVLATDAPLDARQLGRLARRVPLGLARTGTSGGHGSGDLAIAFSTADRIPHDAGPLVRSVQVLNEQNPAIDGLFAAVVETTEEAVINALCTAHSMDGRDNHWAQALSLVETLAILKRYGRIQ
ncbi:aminopeptidase [Ktedonobacter sp. SOSP1-85]|nr:P1 family peptidase [Ktedonobacter sp. SOSP1-85]GHO78328.1 aminopeptidase [Ktedonobacter sp. SOSP1-85]